MSEEFNVEAFIQQCLTEHQTRVDAQQQYLAEIDAKKQKEIVDAANKAREQVLSAIPVSLHEYLKAFDEAGNPVTPARLYLPGCTPIVIGTSKERFCFMPTWADFDPDTYTDRIFYSYELIRADDMAEAVYIAHKNFATIAQAQEKCNRWNEPEQIESKPTHGVCRVCGCTDDHACPGGCSWSDDEHTLCSRCAEKGAPQPDPLALTPENVNQAHVALAGARNAIFNIAIVRDQIKANIKTLKAKAIADGRINGKNEDVREAQSRETFAADYEALADAEIELDKAQLAFDLADTEVKRLRALICLANTKSEPIPF